MKNKLGNGPYSSVINGAISAQPKYVPAQGDKGKQGYKFTKFVGIENTSPSKFKDLYLPVQESQQKVDELTGIESDSPEIILLSDFIPVFNDDGTLNKTGKLLQVRHDGKLASIDTSIKSLLSSEKYPLLRSSLDTRMDALRSFCDEFSNSAKNLFIRISSVQYAFDSRTNSYFLSFGKNNSGVAATPPLTTEQILLDDTDTISKWSRTKLWIQLCLELKEVMKRGLPIGLFSDSTTPTPKKEKNYESPYSIVSAASSDIFRFGYSGNFQIPNIKGSAEDAIDQLYTTFTKSFTKNPFLITGYDPSVLLSTLSHLLCKEYLYSKNIPQALEGYGYPQKNFGWTDAWDYLIGMPGEDITDIPQNPIGAGKSMISLSQSREGNQKVLTFEDRYINDDIGTLDPAVLMAPGIDYYIESSLGTNTTKLDSLIAKTDAVYQTANTIQKNLVFSPKEKINFSEPYSNPIALLDFLKRESLQGSELAKSNPKLWSDVGKTGNDADTPVDVSPLLISAAVDGSGAGAELLCLLFLYLTTKDSTLAEKIVDSLLKKYSVDYENESGKAKSVFEKTLFEDVDAVPPIVEEQKPSAGNVKLLVIKNALLKNLTSDDGLKILNNIASVISNSALSGLFTEGSEESQRTKYSGISRTVYLFTLFFLCCVLVQAALPEGIDAIVPPTAKTVVVETEYDINEYIQILQKAASDALDAGDKARYEQLIYELAQAYGQLAQQEKSLNAGVSDPEVIKGQYAKHTYDVYKEIPDASESILVIGKKKNYYDVDSLLLNSGKSLREYDDTFYLYIDKFSTAVKNVKDSLESLKKYLNSTQHVSFFNKITNIIGADLANLLMTSEQLTLADRKILEISERIRVDYNSPIKLSAPFFMNVKNVEKVDDLLPIQDAQMASWNIFLKKFLLDKAYRDSSGFNKKIMSVGLPQKIYRRLQIDASKNKGLLEKSGLIKINVYRIDALRPDIKHKPLSFIFDVNRYPTKVLSSFLDVEKEISGEANKQNIDLKLIPFFESRPFQNPKLVQSFDDAFFVGYDALPKATKEKIYSNHAISFLLDEYLHLLSGISFDEDRYQQYKTLSFSSNIWKKALGVASESIIGEIPDIFKDSFLAKGSNELIKSFITPRKFDRVFHIIFDPDDFYVDSKTSKDVLEKYLKTQDIEEASVVAGGGVFYKRRTTNKDEITFDRYFVAIETFDESAPGS